MTTGRRRGRLTVQKEFSQAVPYEKRVLNQGSILANIAILISIVPQSAGGAVALEDTYFSKMLHTRP